MKQIQIIIVDIFLIATIFSLNISTTRASVNGFTALFNRFRFARKKSVKSEIIPMMKVQRGGNNNDDASASSLSSSSAAKFKDTILPKNNINEQRFENCPMNFVFSDVDGTLVHYPTNEDNLVGGSSGDDYEGRIIHLPASSTGMRGIISSKTLKLCQNLRRKQNTKLTLVSGMRTSTLLKRLPYLPKADAYASEAGGRIFYPVNDLNGYNGTVIQPIHFDGATEEEIAPFGLVEDMNWRKEMSKESAAGNDGYVGDVFDIFLNLVNEEEGLSSQVKDVSNRKGALWGLANELQKEGFALDTKGYSCCFRVNFKQQSGISEEKFLELSVRDVTQHGLATSVNLGCIDFYPKMSGKKNCCLYLAKKFIMDMENSINKDFISDDILLKQAICLCDDDNDLEMASACGSVFLPSVSSQSMAEAAKQNPDKIFITENEEKRIIGTTATEYALMKASELIQSKGRLRP